MDVSWSAAGQGPMQVYRGALIAALLHGTSAMQRRTVASPAAQLVSH